jgi:hypothetical protein
MAADQTQSHRTHVRTGAKIIGLHQKQLMLFSKSIIQITTAKAASALRVRFIWRSLAVTLGKKVRFADHKKQYGPGKTPIGCFSTGMDGCKGHRRKALDIKPSQSEE